MVVYLVRFIQILHLLGMRRIGEGMSDSKEVARHVYCGSGIWTRYNPGGYGVYMVGTGSSTKEGSYIRSV